MANKTNYNKMSKKDDDFTKFKKIKSIKGEPEIIKTPDKPDVVKEPEVKTKPIGEAIVSAHKLYLRKTADAKGERVSTLSRGARLVIVTDEGEWLGVITENKVGYVMSKYTTVI